MGDRDLTRKRALERLLHQSRIRLLAVQLLRAREKVLHLGGIVHRLLHRPESLRDREAVRRLPEERRARHRDRHERGELGFLLECELDIILVDVVCFGFRLVGCRGGAASESPQPDDRQPCVRFERTGIAVVKNS